MFLDAGRVVALYVERSQADAIFAWLSSDNSSFRSTTITFPDPGVIHQQPKPFAERSAAKGLGCWFAAGGTPAQGP